MYMLLNSICHIQNCDCMCVFRFEDAGYYQWLLARAHLYEAKRQIHGMRNKISYMKCSIIRTFVRLLLHSNTCNYIQRFGHAPILQLKGVYCCYCMQRIHRSAISPLIFAKQGLNFISRLGQSFVMKIYNS